MPLVPRFPLDLSLHPFGESTPTSAYRDTLGESRQSESARNDEKSLPRFRFGFAEAMDPAGQWHTHRLPRAVKATAG
jgi:hypothetical protein